MVSKKLTSYIIVISVLMALFLFLSSQAVLYSVQQRGEAVGQIGLTIDTYYTGPIELTPTYARNEILNLPLFLFIFTVISNVIFMLLLRKEKQAKLHSQASS